MTAPSTVAVFSSRESPAILQKTITAVASAQYEGPLQLDVVVNGNMPLAAEVCSWARRRPTAPRDAFSRLRVWHIALGDKAYAFNHYLHSIWQHQADVAYFVDGYVRPLPDAFQNLRRSLHENPDALGATAVPSVGASARKLREELVHHGGLHGNLFALTGGVVADLQRRGFSLPLGLYRVDSTLGAVLCFRLNPAEHEWDPLAIAVCESASWDNDTLAWYKLTHIQTQLRRTLRQFRGRLENAAVRKHLAVDRKLPEELPATVEDLVLSWYSTCGAQERQRTLTNPFHTLALRKIRNGRNEQRLLAQPTLLCDEPLFPQ